MTDSTKHCNTRTVEKVFKELCRNQLRHKPERNYSSRIVRDTGLGRKSVAGALNHLERIGVVKREWNGRRKQLTVNPGVLDALTDGSDSEPEVEA